MLALANGCLMLCVALVYGDLAPDKAELGRPPATLLVKDVPAYRDSVIQATDPTKPADPSLAVYTKDSASYRANGPVVGPTPSAPAPVPVPALAPSPALALSPAPPTMPAPQTGVLESDFRVPNNAEGVVQNITVVVPSNAHLPNKHFYDQLAQGKTPLQNKKRAICCAPGFVNVYNSPRGFVTYDPSTVAASPYPFNVANPNFVVAPQSILPPPEPIPLIVDVEWLDRALMNHRRIRLLDATPSHQSYNIDYRQFRDQYYGKFDLLFNERPNLDFQRLHIPTAIHFNFDIATYPAWNDPSALYPPELFQQYVRRLGVNADDHIVVYSRGTLGGMLESARVWNMFRIYGHHKISVLDGGFEAWRSANLSLTDVSEPIQPGNWTAGFDPGLLIAYEDLAIPGSDGFCVLNRLNWYNFLDARPKPDYYGLYPILNNQQLSTQNPSQNGPNFVQNSNAPIPLPPNTPRRSHVPGAKSLPAEDLIRPDGFTLPIAEIKTRLQQAGYQPGRESVAAGNTPEEASMVVLALALVQDPKVRLYNAGIPEMRLRLPQLINA